MDGEGGQQSEGMGVLSRSPAPAPEVNATGAYVILAGSETRVELDVPSGEMAWMGWYR